MKTQKAVKVVDLDIDAKLEAFKKWNIDEGNDNDGVEIDGNTVTDGSSEYLILTDEEADEMAKEYILDTAWGFNKSFLDSHSEAIAEIDDKSYAKLQEGCESINKAVLAMIDDKDHFVEDAIASDGRGHFLSPYDGEENEVKIAGTYYFIYRTN